MDNKFVLLDCDEDMVLFEKDTFKVGRLKELGILKVRQKLDNYIYDSKIQQRGQSITYFLGNIAVGEELIDFSHFQYNCVKDCQLLQLSSMKGWQKGKLKIQIHISVQYWWSDKVCLEFYPDEPIEAESPLDDLRKQIQRMQP